MPVNKKNNTKKNHHANKKNKNYRAEKPIVKKEIHEITYSDGMTVGELADKDALYRARYCYREWLSAKQRC